MQAKIRITLVTFFLLFIFLSARLFYWQVVMAQELSEKAQGQYNSSVVTSAPRGNIISADGSFWVLRNNVWQVTANPKLIKIKTELIASGIAPLLVENKDDSASVSAMFQKINNVLSKNNSSWVQIAGRVSDSVKKSIQSMDIEGITFSPGEGRFYPEASSAAQLLGFVGKDSDGGDIGYFGLEGYYNLPLSGKSGFVGLEKDARGTPILLRGTKEISAINGVNLVTGIDKRIQLLIESKLEEGITKYGAKGGSITIMNPYTGTVMAMASSPSFDPSKYSQYSNQLFKNPIISDTFEPGSIFKPIVMAAALDGGYITPTTECDICDGPLNVDGYQIKTWNNKYKANATMTEVLVESDNVGMSFVAQKMGAETFQDYIEKFGIGEITGIDLQGEASMSLRKRGTWSNVDLDTASFGQGVATTGIQIVRAISVIANGGYLVTPHVVTEIQGDGWKNKVEIAQPNRIISQRAAIEAAQMMADAANIGESKWAKMPGFNNIAAKTGTAQIPVAGHYDATNTNHSFVGFAPIGHPKLIMLVTLQSPQSSLWAAETAAPLWYSIARDLFPYLGIQPGDN